MSVLDLASSGPTIPSVPLGSWVESIVHWLNNNLGPFFDGITTAGKVIFDELSRGLIAVPWPVMILIFIALGWWLRSWKFAVFAAFGPLLVVSLGLWDDAMQTLALVIIAAVVALVLAVPIGIAAGQSTAVSRIVKPVLDLMQTMPAFVYLIPAVILFAIGAVPGIIATVVFAMPPGVRLTELGIRQVDREVVEAGESFGASPMKVLMRIKLPLALGTIMAGVNQVIMLALSMVVIAGMTGAPGLGQDVTSAVANVQIGSGFEGGVAVVILAIFLDRISDALGNRAAPVAKLERRARKEKRRQTRQHPAVRDDAQTPTIGAGV